VHLLVTKYFDHFCIHILSVGTSLKSRFNIIWSSGVFQVVSSVQGFRQNFCTHFSPMPPPPIGRIVLQAPLPLHTNSQRPLLKHRPSVRDRVAINVTDCWGATRCRAADRSTIPRSVPKDGISRYFGNCRTYIPDYTASHLRRWSISGHLYQNFRRIYYTEFLWFESYIKFL
jgi:hypothetical protein